jgi:glyoxylase-like metal-dependent hydrolase (beta-lactamase superfamily II)
MALVRVLPSLYRVDVGHVNSFVIDCDEGGLVLVDAGTPDDAGRILRAINELGREATDVRHILVTHCHNDHAGGLAELKEATKAPSYMHPADAEMVRAGRAVRPFTRTPGVLDDATYRALFSDPPSAVPAAEVEHEVSDGEVLPIAGGVEAVHAPGHCAGQLAFLWPRHGGVLFAADAAANVMGILSLSPIHEDLEDGERSARKLAGLGFEAACFGHGQDIVRKASARLGEALGSIPTTR